MDHSWNPFDELSAADKVRFIEEVLVAQFPDEADEFEDRLAAKLGLVRHPGLSQEEWRRVRVEYLRSTTATEKSHREVTSLPRR